MRLSNLGRFKIPFLFAGTSHVLKITKFTTCDDVVEMILLARGENTDPKQYVMYEMTSGAQRALQGRDLVVKVWRSWGCEGRNFSFRIDQKGNSEVARRGGLCLKKYSPENNIDKLFTNGRNTNTSLEETFVASYTSYCESNVSESSGKRFVLAKFFKDLKDHVGKRRSLRKSGYGTSNLATQLERTREHFRPSTSFEQCQYLWNKYSGLESDSDNYSESEFSCSKEEQILDLNSTRGISEALDNAFVKGSLGDVDEGIDVTSLTSAELNDAFIDNDLYAQSQREQSDASSVASDASELHANASLDDDYVRALFGSGDVNRGSEDDDMESFMCSRLESMLH